MKTILFKNTLISPKLKRTGDLKKFLSSVFESENVAFDTITYIFCNDAYLLELNKEFLKHETLTDILTFQLSEPNTPIVSEIYISVERVKENSILFGSSYLNELLRVILHGILHLCGYSDDMPSNKKEMRNKENFYLSQLSFT